LKKANRRLYYVLKYAAIAGALYVVFFRGLIRLG
jgi:hypothetical protein